MSNPLLSILIPTVVGREKELENILNVITDQIVEKEGRGWVGEDERFFGFDIGFIQIICCKDNKEISIGEKREWLYAKADGMYSWQLDEDDSIVDNAIELILEAIKSNPEIPCITFREKCMMNGEYKSSNHSIKYDKWQDGFDGYDYVRCPFYKDVIRTDIAISVPFPHIRYNEDEQWSMAIKPFLTDEIHINEELYYYIYEPKEDFNTRYGINPVS